MNKFNYFPWLLLLNIDRVITALVNTSDFSLPCIISLFKVATNPCFKGEKVNITSIAELVHVTQRVSSRLSRQRHPSGALSDYFFFLVSGRNCPARNLGPFAPGSSAVRGVCAVLCCAVLQDVLALTWRWRRTRALWWSLPALLVCSAVRVCWRFLPAVGGSTLQSFASCSCLQLLPSFHKQSEVNV